ncbi:hypothetical protein JZ751_022463 [Albula glossodonta]|uniref:Jade n=1 Tax=Albula glossodonta TaxID=121402 RepID=A0A8T2NTX8_9TELE|nr:hypothetical protein JZ751_022463 [Albula glossodonta]
MRLKLKRGPGTVPAQSRALGSGFILSSGSRLTQWKISSGVTTGERDRDLERDSRVEQGGEQVLHVLTDSVMAGACRPRCLGVVTLRRPGPVLPEVSRIPFYSPSPSRGFNELGQGDSRPPAEPLSQYDLDDLDVAWLELVNAEFRELALPELDELTMERVVMELESQCQDNMQLAIETEEGLGIEYDEDVVCDVCRSPEGEDGNEMVFCDKCNICVHQACYGILKVPLGNWLCRTCALGVQPKCLLCPKRGGALKPTRSGTKWVHVSCALWIPEVRPIGHHSLVLIHLYPIVSIGCPEKMEPITKVSHIPASRWALSCSLCREHTGTCIQVEGDEGQEAEAEPWLWFSSFPDPWDLYLGVMSARVASQPPLYRVQFTHPGLRYLTVRTLDPAMAGLISKSTAVRGSVWTLESESPDLQAGFDQCSMPSCIVAFHVTCAFDHGLEMRTILAENDEVRFKSYCLEHSSTPHGSSKVEQRPEQPGSEQPQPLPQPQTQPPTQTPPERPDQTELEKASQRKQKLQELEDEFYLLVNPKDVAENLGLPDAHVDFLYQYWKLRRKSNFNQPLITLKRDEVDNLAQQEQDVLYRRLKLFTHLRQDLERVSSTHTHTHTHTHLWQDLERVSPTHTHTHIHTDLWQDLERVSPTHTHTHTHTLTCGRTWRG